MKLEMPPSLTDCVTTGAFANPSVPQFPHLSNEMTLIVNLAHRVVVKVKSES